MRKRTRGGGEGGGGGDGGSGGGGEKKEDPYGYLLIQQLTATPAKLQPIRCMHLLTAVPLW